MNRKWSRSSRPGLERLEDRTLPVASGLFQPPANNPVGQSPYTVAVARLDADDTLDLVVADFNTTGENVSVLLGNGERFRRRETQAAGDIR